MKQAEEVAKLEAEEISRLEAELQRCKEDMHHGEKTRRELARQLDEKTQLLRETTQTLEALDRRLAATEAEAKQLKEARRVREEELASSSVIREADLRREFAEGAAGMQRQIAIGTQPSIADHAGSHDCRYHQWNHQTS